MKIEVSFPGGKRVDGAFKGFTVDTDQPLQDGGEGSAPTPFELFQASLATCAGIYVLEFCRARDLPTEGLSLSYDSTWDREKKLLTRIVVSIRIPESFPTKYEEAVIRAASHCTVKRHLENPPEIETRIVKT